MRYVLRCIPLVFLMLVTLTGAAYAADLYWIQGAIALVDGRPVENVAIYMDGQPATSTGISGLYFIPEAEAGQHLIQPVKAGYTFVPESVKVLLPPDAGDVNFTAFQTGGNEAPTLLAPDAQEEPPPRAGQSLWTTVSGLMALWRQLQILLMLLSLGAFLVLAARWLANKNWNQQPAAVVESAQEELAEPVTPWEAVNTPEPEARETLENPEPVAAEAEPVSEGPSGGEDVAAVLKEAISLVRSGDTAQGMVLLRQATQAQPDNAEAWFWLGAGSMLQNELRTAERCFKQAQRLGHPRAGEALERLKGRQ